MTLPAIRSLAARISARGIASSAFIAPSPEIDVRADTQLPRALIEKAGFRLAGVSEINANAKDTKDHPEGVWTLPPTYRLKDKDRAKYLAIGESDRFTLRFVKLD